MVLTIRELEGSEEKAIEKAICIVNKLYPSGGDFEVLACGYRE